MIMNPLMRESDLKTERNVIIQEYNDGIDDTWFIKHPFGMKLDVKVVNRWGNEVYSNPDYKNDWRGKGIKNFLGEDLPEGTYYYVVHTIDRNGLSNKFAGPLTIIR